jgi:hypothetical protein
MAWIGLLNEMIQWIMILGIWLILWYLNMKPGEKEYSDGEKP